jgi:molybdate transport system regulatory protein
MEELGLCPGRSVTLLIKAPFVAIATGKTAPKTSARNCIRGIISRCEASDVNAEIILDIGAGKTLTSSITSHSAKSLGLSPRKPAFALFDAAHVIIAIN